MNTILDGLMTASSAGTVSEERRQKVFKMIENAAIRQHGPGEIMAVLKCIRQHWISTEIKEASLKTDCQRMYSAWARRHPSAIAQSIIDSPKDFVMLPDRIHVECTCAWTELILSCLASFQVNLCASNQAPKNGITTASKSSQSFTMLVRDYNIQTMIHCSESVADLAAVVQLIAKYPVFLALKENAEIFLENLVKKLGDMQVDLESVSQFTHNSVIVAKFIQNICKIDLNTRFSALLKNIFDIISVMTGNSVGYALCPVLQIVPKEMIHPACHQMVVSASISNQQVISVLQVLTDWLSWPKHHSIHTWINELYVAMKEGSKVYVLSEVTRLYLPKTVLKLKNEAMQESILTVVETMLLSNQSCPSAFHTCLPTLVSAVDWMKDEPLATRVAHLIQITMFIFPGYPEIYTSVDLSKYTLMSHSSVKDKIDDYKPKSGASRFSYGSSIRKVAGEKTGLANLGNTCFMNSVVQALHMIEAFRQHILDESANQASQPILSGLQEVFALLSYTQRSFLKILKFVRKSLPSWFVVGSQQDSSEYLRYILDTMVEHQKVIKSAEVAGATCAGEGIASVFQGKTTSVTKCLACGYESKNYEIFLDIPLHFPESQKKTYELTELIEEHFKQETLNGENQYSCDKCEKLQDATRWNNVTIPPYCLTLTLCRFAYTKSHQRTKIRTPVTYPSTLELFGQSYILNAVIVHSGYSLDGGHYYTYAKQPVPKSSKWYLFNDDRVTQADPNTQSLRLSADTPYILMYMNTRHCKDQSKFTPNESIRQLITKDNLAALNEEQGQERKKRPRNVTSFQPPYTKDEDDEDPSSSGGNNSIDLSGSRFIF